MNDNSQIPQRKAKIVCTVGPETRQKPKAKELILAGMNVARLNFSHDVHEEHAKGIKNIRELSQELNKPVAILQDLQGPKIRTGLLKEKSVELKTGQEFTITTEDVEGDNTIVGTTYPNLAKDLNKGDLVLVDDGNMRLEVLESDDIKVKCKVLFGGTLKNNKGINVPFLKLSTPAISEKDKKDLAFGIQQNVDYVALSFVREAKDVVELRELIKSQTDRNIQIIAKIEKPQAMDNIDEILEVTDGIMVARGDLGIELQIDKVPAAQKTLIKKANQRNKMVITATQMLESMITNPIPTRAEASDVANAIFDGTDAVMLSGETANGAFPVETVETMSSIVCNAEAYLADNKSDFHKPELLEGAEFFRQIIADMACETANRTNAKAIVVISSTGSLPRRISKGRPNSPILALTASQDTLGTMSLFWGVSGIKEESISLDKLYNINELQQTVNKVLLESKLLEKGDTIVMASSTGLEYSDETNFVKIHVLK